MDRIYSRINWKDEPDLSTPLGAVNLNRMDLALYTIDGRVVDLDNIVSSLSSDVTNITSDVDDLEQNKADKSEIVDKFADLNDIAFTNLRNGQVPKYNSTTQKWENADESGGGGSGGHIIQNPSGSSMTQRNYLQFTGTGISVTDDNTNGKTVVTVTGGTGGSKGHLIVISETGSIVRITKDQTTVYATETSTGTGHFECDIPEFGVWIIHAVLNGDDAQVSLNVDTDKVYTIDDSHFHADITVTYPTGATVSCSKTGEQTMYATGSPYTFTVHSAGEWTITGTRSGITETQTVIITSSGQTESVTLTILPDGSTITPTDDVQILLNCADIWDKTSYTTIADLIADDTSLLKVLTSDNAVDYLVRSTTFASAITADSDAMAMIGSYDYASDTLLTDSTWATAILNSTYKDSVVNYTNPTMTSNTLPSGTASASSEYDSTYQAWKAFDDNTSTQWHSATQGDGWVQYQNSNPVTIVKAEYYVSSAPTSIMFKASADGFVSDVHEVTESLTSISAQTLTDVLFSKNVGKYDYYRMALANSSYVMASKIKFYGRQNGGVQTWLKAGGITDKSYTTLAEVLADTTTLSALIANHDAVDYLVTAKAFIDGIVADSNAMSYIGLNNYCANSLIADSEWLTAIANSTYMESVLNIHTPTMTSNTTPSGVASANASYTSLLPWKSFDKSTTDGWGCGSTGANQWIQYQFPSAFKCVLIVYTPQNASRISSLTFKVSNDGTNFDTPTLSLPITEGVQSKVVWNNDTAYEYYRMNFTASDLAGGFKELDFYGRQDV